MVIKNLQKIINFKKTPPKKAFSVQTSEEINKKHFENQEKWVCILILLVQMSEGINFNRGFRVFPDEILLPFFRRRSKNGLLAKICHHDLRAQTESAKQRIYDLDKLFSRIYEDNILGKLSDERYSRMASEYETEQKQLMQEVKENEKALVELQKQTVDMKMLYQGLMEFTEMKELTPTVVNKLIERIEIHNNEKKHSHNNVKVDIYFTAIGLFDIPTKQQLIDTMERVKQKKAEKSA